MAGPIDALKRLFGGEAALEASSLPQVPSPAPQAAPPPAPLPRIPVRDTRPVPPTQRLAGNYMAPVLETVAREARVAGMPPDLALAMAIRENSTGLSQKPEWSTVTGNPMHLNARPWWLHPDIEGSRYVDDDTARQPYTEAAMMHAIERASTVAGAGRNRQVQAYNGLGKQHPGFNTRFAHDPNPYAAAVEEIRTGVVQQSPALLSLIKNLSPTLNVKPMIMEHALAVSDTLDRRRRHPNLFR